MGKAQSSQGTSMWAEGKSKRSGHEDGGQKPHRRRQCAPKRTEKRQMGTRCSAIAGLRAEDCGSSSIAEPGSC